MNNIAIRENKFSHEDIEKCKYLAYSIYQEYLHDREKISEMFSMSIEKFGFIFDKINNYTSNYLEEIYFENRLRERTWIKVLDNEFIRKYLSTKHKLDMYNKFKINDSYIGTLFENSKYKEKDYVIEPTLDQMERLIIFLVSSKDNLVNESLFKAIQKNARIVKRCSNKPLEIEKMIIIDGLEDYYIRSQYTSKTLDELHKALIAFFDLDYSKYRSPYFFHPNFTDSKEEKKEASKIKKEYLPGIYIQTMKSTMRIYFDDKQRNMINEALLEYFKTSLIE